MRELREVVTVFRASGQQPGSVAAAWAAEALRSLRSEDNRRLMDETLRTQQTFAYRPGMFDGDAPGAVLAQGTPVATPGLVGE